MTSFSRAAYRSATTATIFLLCGPACGDASGRPNRDENSKVDSGHSKDDAGSDLHDAHVRDADIDDGDSRSPECRDDSECNQETKRQCVEGTCEQCDPVTYDGCAGGAGAVFQAYKAPVCERLGGVTKCRKCKSNDECAPLEGRPYCVDGQCAECSEVNTMGSGCGTERPYCTTQLVSGGGPIACCEFEFCLRPAP